MMESRECADPRMSEWVGAYELGLLSPEERAEFEEHLTSCTACLEELYAQAPIACAMTQYAGAVMAATARQEGSPRRVPCPWWRELGARIAGLFREWTPRRVGFGFALAVAGILAAVMLRPQTPDTYGDLARLRPVPYSLREVRGEAGSGAAALFGRGMRAYASHRYEEAVGPLAESVRSWETGGGGVELDQARLYLGVSLLLSRRVDEARVPLEHAVCSPIRRIADRARWSLVQAHLRAGNPALAEEGLRILADSSATYAKDAREQLQELRELRSRIEGR
jgi:hypothetical protein